MRCSRLPSTQTMPLGLHPPASFAPPSKSYGFQPVLFRPLRLGERLPWSFFPHRDFSTGVHHSAASISAVTFRPRRFARPRRFLPPMPLQACFIPLPRPGFALQGFVPLRGAAPAFTGLVPSCPLSERRLRFDPRQRPSAPGFRVLLPAMSAVPPGVVQTPRDPRPSWASADLADAPLSKSAPEADAPEATEPPTRSSLEHATCQCRRTVTVGKHCRAKRRAAQDLDDPLCAGCEEAVTALVGKRGRPLWLTL